MTDQGEILVLIADENKATLSASTGGVTQLLRSIERVLKDTSHIGEEAIDSRRRFACELMMALCRSVGERICDGVVIFAEAPMMDELREVQTSSISRLMVAHIVGKPSQASQFPSRFPGVSAANAELDYRGAVS